MKNSFLIYTTCDFPLPFQINFQDPASPIMEGIILLHNFIMLFLVGVLAVVFSMLFFTLRTSYIDTSTPFKEFKKVQELYSYAKITHHAPLETIWTIIPTIILLIIAVPSFQLLYAMDTLPADPRMTLKVIGHQWYWSYEYVFYMSTDVSYKFARFSFDSYMIPTDELSPGQWRLLEVDNPCVLPYGQYIRVLVTSADVIHSWAIPSLGIKCDAIPGRLNEIYIYMYRKGKFYGQCSEICGVNHGFMPIVVLGISMKEFQVWAWHSIWSIGNIHEWRVKYFINN